MSSLNYIIPFVVYIIIANPETYKIVRGIVGKWVASADGLATLPGLILHAAVYIAIVGWFMTVLNPEIRFETRGDQQAEESKHWIQRNEMMVTY
jgi:hypothetical protein